MWDFWPLSPESLHQVTMLFSDRGLPVSPMHMNGYGSHTYSLWNDKGERVWVKLHFKTRQGYRHYTNAEAADVVGRTREGYVECEDHVLEALLRIPLGGLDHHRAGQWCKAPKWSTSCAPSASSTGNMSGTVDTDRGRSIESCIPDIKSCKHDGVEDDQLHEKTLFHPLF